ncbi:MAG TPA: c-type cytochrome [Caulobacteraceae bacterium]|nr:c-type cytochrome [Caulobacteraceae bacterium]
MVRRARLGVVAAFAVLCACAGGPELGEIEPPARAAFRQVEIDHGAQLAAAGDCFSCHTTDDGYAYAGGRPVKTPFGAVFATNITPAHQTGIGGYAREAFVRAMRQGVRRDGAHLYPAFPYDHFSATSDEDLSALYAFLMTRQAVEQKTPPNRLVPPVGFRPVIAVWKALFFRPTPFRPVSGKSAEWNRGAYLVDSLGHCGGCHTPHNWLGAEQRKKALDGGWAEGWYAPPLNGRSPAAVPWTVDRLRTYLKTGLDPAHAAAAGPMGEVTRQLTKASDADVHAMAVFLADQMDGVGRSAPIERAAEAARAHPQGAALFAGACAACHDPGAPMMLDGRPPLQLGTPLHEDDPRDVIAIILKGLKSPSGSSGPYMPSFEVLTDDQVSDVAAYLRARFSDKPAWTNLTAAVSKARKEAS